MEAMHENKPHLIQDIHDPRFLFLRSLQHPHGRLGTGLFLIEGIRHVARAVEHRFPIHSFFVDPSQLSNPFGRRLAQKLQRMGVPGLKLLPRIYRQLTLAAEPQGIGAVVKQQWKPLAAVQPGADSLWLAIEALDSPGNFGTIIRTAEATGISGIFVIGAGVDPWDPATVRASMGSLFSQKFIRCSAHEFIDWAKRYGVTIVGSSPAGLLDYKTLQWRWPAALLIGSEKLGLSEQLTDASDFMVRIPMLGRGDSINAAVAAGVLLYEMFNQRRGA